MPPIQSAVQKSQTAISALELKQLLIALTTLPHICFRYRTLGEMWVTHHMKVDTVNDKTVLLYSEPENKYFLVKLNSIMQFDLDERFQSYQPNNHYNVIPSPELD
jgi:hypothetical protein